MSRVGRPTLWLFLGVICLASACSIVSQERGRLRARRDAKLAKPVFSAAPWHTDFDRARDVAAKEGKVLLAYFTSTAIT